MNTLLSLGITPFSVSLGEPPRSVWIPEISGSFLVGETITSSQGVWENSGGVLEYSFQWYRFADGIATPISGEDNSTYILSETDIDCEIFSEVTCVNAYGSAKATSEKIILPAACTSPPTITGTFSVGNTLTAHTGTWVNISSPTVFLYEWFRNNVQIDGAEESTYVLTTEDSGAQIHVTISSGNIFGLVSDTSVQYDISLINATPPVLSGTAAPGNKLSVTNGVWENVSEDTIFTYQWFETPHVEISGETRNTYTALLTDSGKDIFVEVTATNVLGSVSEASNTLTIT